MTQKIFLFCKIVNLYYNSCGNNAKSHKILQNHALLSGFPHAENVKIRAGCTEVVEYPDFNRA